MDVVKTLKEHYHSLLLTTIADTNKTTSEIQKIVSEIIDKDEQSQTDSLVKEININTKERAKQLATELKNRTFSKRLNTEPTDSAAKRPMINPDKL